MFFHGTQYDVVPALLFCCGAVERLLRVLGPSAEAASCKTVDELLAVCNHLHLNDEVSVLQRIASSQVVSLPSDLCDISWLRRLLLDIFSTLSSRETRMSPASPKSPKTTCSARFHDSLLRFGYEEIGTYCTGQSKDLKSRGSLD